MRARFWAAMIAASIGWGTSGIATRAAFHQGLGPYTIVALRSLFAAGVFLAWRLFAWRLLRRRALPGPRVWLLGGLIGLTNYTGPIILFTLAVQYTSAGFIGLLAAASPLVTAVFAHFLLPNEKLSRGKALGLALAVGGVTLLTATGESGLTGVGLSGAAVGLALGGVVVSSLGAVHARVHAPENSALDLAGTQLALGAVVLIVVMLAVEGLPVGISAAGWGLLLYMTLVSTLVPSALFFWMLQRVGATTASLPSYLIPVVALAGGVVLLDERVTWLMGVGGMLILAGVIFTERGDPIPRGAARESAPAP